MMNLDPEFPELACVVVYLLADGKSSGKFGPFSWNGASWSNSCLFRRRRYTSPQRAQPRSVRVALSAAPAQSATPHPLDPQGVSSGWKVSPGGFPQGLSHYPSEV